MTEDIPEREASPDEAYDLGESLGRWRAEEEAICAYKAGEIDLWIDMVTPKTLEEWDAWEKEHGSTEELRNRWKV